MPLQYVLANRIMSDNELKSRLEQRMSNILSEVRRINFVGPQSRLQTPYDSSLGWFGWDPHLLMFEY